MYRNFGRLVFLCLVFIFQINFVKANSKFLKGETKTKIVSPLVVLLQEVDSSYVKKYEELKKLFEKEDYTTSLRDALSLLKEIESKNYAELEYLTNFLIGDIFRKRNDHEKSLIYFKKALKLVGNNQDFDNERLKSYGELLKKEKSLAQTLLRIGAEFYKLNKIDSAATYFKRIIEIPSSNNFPDIKASVLTNLSGIYWGKEDYKLAKKYAFDAIDTYRNNNNKLLEASALNNLANIYLSEENYDMAKKTYEEAIELIKFDESIYGIKTKEDLYYNLAYTLFLQKDYNAYDFLRKSYVQKDTLTSRELKRIVQGVYAEYQEQYRVELVKNKVELKKIEQSKTKWFFGILSFLVIVISGVILYNYKLRQKNLQLQFEQEAFEQKSKLDKLRSESQTRILNATIDGKESERKEIAETLHDSVSSLLSSANLHLQASKNQFNGSTPIEIEKTQQIITEASQKIRDLSHTLVSSVLLKFGLNYAVKDMAEKYSNSQLEIETDIRNIKRYHQGFEIKVYNIIQELVNNILKHSNATKAFIRIEEEKGKLEIKIQDNGIGFDINEIPEKEGLGINQIEARVKIMQGKFKINSTSVTGTNIIVELPILKKESATLA